MTKKQMEEMGKMMIQTFNDDCEQVIFPRLEVMQEEIEDKLGKRIVDSEKRIKKELREEFKAGQHSLSHTLEEVSRKLDEVAKETKGHGKRLDKLERIVKAN